MTITAREIVKSIKETNIYFSTNWEIEKTIAYAIREYSTKVDDSLSFVKSLPSKNTETIQNIREIQYHLTYEKESLETALHEHLSLIKLHEII